MSTTTTKAPAASRRQTPRRRGTGQQPVGAVGAALQAAKVSVQDLDAQQMKRARSAPAGLRGKALAHYVLTGETAAQQVRAAKTAREASKPERRRAEGPRPGSTLAGAIAVLTAKGKPMTSAEIHREIVKRKLCPTLGGKTPVATIQAQLALANKRGEHVCRPEPGVYALRTA